MGECLCECGFSLCVFLFFCLFFQVVKRDDIAVLIVFYPLNTPFDTFNVNTF